MSDGAVRVVKLGGSLLDWPELTEGLGRWLTAQPPAANVLIVGGGTLVDKLRELDSAHAFSPTAAHWLCIRAMSLTAAMVAEMLPEATRADALEQLRFNQGSSVQILDVEKFLRQDQQSSDPLPCGWEVTSDSIAARVAAVLGARELVLLKSRLPPGPASRDAIVRSEYVDAYFARSSRGMCVRCVNLRNPVFPQIDVE